MLHFSIRELVLLTLVVAAGFGWWVDRSRLWQAGVEDRNLVQRYKTWNLDKVLVFYERLGESAPRIP